VTRPNRKHEEELLGKSSAFGKKGQDAENERLLRGAIEQSPEHPDFRMRLADVLFETSPRESVDLIHRAVELSREDPWMLLRAASLLFYHQEFEPSLEYTKRAVKIGESVIGRSGTEVPDYMNDLLHLMGRHLSRLGQDDAAEDALRTAFEVDPQASEHGRVLADFYASRERPVEALEVIEKALRVRGEDQSLLRTRERIIAHFPESAP